jgi:hypothetical protein
MDNSAVECRRFRPTNFLSSIETQQPSSGRNSSATASRFGTSGKKLSRWQQIGKSRASSPFTGSPSR